MSDSGGEARAGARSYDDAEIPARNLLIIAKGFPPSAGGVEQYSFQVAAAYIRSGFKVRVMTQAPLAAGWTTQHCSDGTYELWNSGPGSQLRTAVRMFVTALRVRLKFRPQYVHSTTWRVGVIARLLFRSSFNVASVHGREVLNYPRWARPLMTWTLSHAAVVLSVSSATEELARAALGKAKARGQWAVSHNGLTYREEAISAPAREPLPTRVRILSLCRLVPRKNVDSTLLALSRLTSDEQGLVHLRIAGQGPELKRLQTLADSLQLRARVDFLGYVDEERVTDLYRWADIFIHPHSHIGEGSDFEGFGIVIADAMSFGCVCIVGDAGGPRELISDAVSGHLVDGNNPDAVAERIRALLHDRPGMTRMGDAAREAALSRFSWDSHVSVPISMFRHRLS